MEDRSAIIYARQSIDPNAPQSLLRGSITCGYCGRQLAIVDINGKAIYQRNNNAEGDGVTIPTEALDAAVWDNVTQLIQSQNVTLFSSVEPISEEMREVREMLRVPVVNEPTIEEKRQVLQILGTTVALYTENDLGHSDRFKIKYQATSQS